MSKSICELIIIVFLLSSCVGANQNQSASDGIQGEDQTCIQKVLTEDESAGEYRNHACEKIALSQAIVDYTAKLDKIDFSNCPTSFEKAFKSHIEAWRSVLPITDKYPELRGEMHDLFSIIEKGPDGEEFKTLVADLWSTWSVVENTSKSN